MNNKEYITISEINHLIKEGFDENPFFSHVYLKGEISNFKNHSRGHLYFSLKDNDSKINAVMFYNNALSLNFEPVDGDQVLVSGRISCYEAQGTYQIYVTTMEKDGLGNLYIEYEKLKKKLNEMGYFDPTHKLPIPKYPSRIGVITAPTGAAIKDIISTIKRRFPICEVYVFPTLVQGALAKDNITKQIAKAQDYDLDLIICGRGGGSIEDLWAFNEEVVCKAIYDSKVPIISAVGHEIDFTLADYVADLRAPTPTGAAEMGVPVVIDVLKTIDSLKIRASEAMKNSLSRQELVLNRLMNAYVLKNPYALYEIKEQKLDTLIDNLQKNMNFLLENKNFKYQKLIDKLKILNPLNILDSGYSLVTKNDKIIKSVSDLNVNDEVRIKVLDGEFISTVKEIKNEK